MRFRLYPTPVQEAGLRGHCVQARFVWNLALEQTNWYRPEWGPTPGYVAQSAQLTEARAASEWLAAGSFTVQQQALRDFAQAMKYWWAGTHGRPTWRKKGRREGFRIVAVKTGHVRRLNRRAAEVFVPKVGWVRFRLTRPLPRGAKSYRVTLAPMGRWHIGFALKPEPIKRISTGAAVGVDRGVVNTLATSDGQLLHVPELTLRERAHLVRLQRRLARRKKGSRRREQASRRCRACGHVAAENRKSQAVFGCVACGHVAHADVNAALNILAAGRAVTAHGEAVVVASMNCEPQHAPPTAA